MHSIESALVTIRYVDQSRTRGTWTNPQGLRRFVIGAERAGVDRDTHTLDECQLSFSTLDPVKADRCAKVTGTAHRLVVTFRRGRYFDAALLSVAPAPEI